MGPCWAGSWPSEEGCQPAGAHNFWGGVLKWFECIEMNNDWSEQLPQGLIATAEWKEENEEQVPSSSSRVFFLRCLLLAECNGASCSRRSVFSGSRRQHHEHRTEGWVWSWAVVGNHLTGSKHTRLPGPHLVSYKWGSTSPVHVTGVFWTLDKKMDEEASYRP